MPYQANSLTNLYTLALNLGGDGIKDAQTLVNDASDSYIQHINSASDWFEGQVGFPLFSGSLQDEWFEGDDSSEHYVQRAITNLSSVHIYSIVYLEGDETTDLFNITDDTPEYKWTYDTETGRIWFTDGNRFHSHVRGIDNWRVKYAYGLSGSVASVEGLVLDTIVPSRIQSAISLLVKRRANLANELGVTGTSTAAGTNVTYNPDFIPREVWDAVNYYKRYVY